MDKQLYPFALFLILFALTQNLYAQHAKKALDPLLIKHVKLLNEFSDRRKVNDIFVNQQSMFYGADFNYVKSSKGNLSFVRRDMVVPGRIPIVISRVYDSSIENESKDFGVGWVLPFSESITKTSDGGFIYRDDSGAKYHLDIDATPAALKASQSNIAKIHRDKKGAISIELRNGWTKVFKLKKGGYRLSSIKDNNNNKLKLTYSKNKLKKIKGSNGRYALFTRDKDGRIAKVTDDQGREVTYAYTSTGELDAVTDIGGNEWKYHYNDNGKLTQALDPQQQVNLSVAYYADNKVKKSSVRGDKNTFTYHDASTDILDGLARATVVSHFENGALKKIVNRNGLSTSIELDAFNNVTKVFEQGKPYGTFEYNEEGELVVGRLLNESGEVTTVYTYDVNKKIIQIADQANTIVSLEYDEAMNVIRRTDSEGVSTYRYNKKGDVSSVTKGNDTTSFKYDADGLITQVSNHAGTSLLAYNALAKLSSVTFPNGAVHKYAYNKLGFRSKVSRSDGSFNDYTYDNIGNLIAASGSDGSKRSGSMEIEVSQDNQVKNVLFSSGEKIQVVYNAKQQPEQITVAGETANYQYDDDNRLTSVSVQGKSTVEYDYEDYEPDLRLTLDKRTAPISLSGKASQSGSLSEVFYTRAKGAMFQNIDFLQNISTLRLLDTFGFSNDESVYLSSIQRRRLYNLTDDALDQINFDKPSNSFFLPPEYNTINCFVCKLVSNTMYGPSSATVGSTSIFNVVNNGSCYPVIVNKWYLNDTYLGEDAGPGTRAITFTSAGQNTVKVKTFCPCGGSEIVKSKTVSVKPPTIGLNAPSSLTLLDNYSLKASVQPSSVSASNHHFEIRKSSSSTWYTLQSGSSGTFSSYAKVAGNFDVRVTTTVGQNTYASPVKTFSVDFPNYNQIVSNSTVISATNSAWSNILNATTPTLRREEGFWIFINTKTRKYEIGNTILGNLVGNLQTATLSPGSKPPDSNTNPTPVSALTYTIAFFHGHTPTLYRPGGRGVGPSSADNTFHNGQDVVGVIYDYVESPPGSGSIPMGHPLNSAAQRYSSGLKRRMTPQ